MCAVTNTEPNKHRYRFGFGICVLKETKNAPK